MESHWIWLVFIGTILIIISAIGYAVNRKADAWIWILLIIGIVSLIIGIVWAIGTAESMNEPYIKAAYSEK
jgi:hypothetical protein